MGSALSDDDIPACATQMRSQSEMPLQDNKMMSLAAWLRHVLVLGWAIVGLGVPVGCKSESAYERDIRLRGKGSQEAWLQATGGRYNGNLPRE